jgi:hypothetical protein
VNLSNAFSTAPLHFISVHIAHPISTSSPAIDPTSVKALTFSGSADITVHAGAEYISDSINYSAAALSNLAIAFAFLRQRRPPASIPIRPPGHGHAISL